MRKLLILGAGGYGRTVADVAAQLGCYDHIYFLDDGRRGEGILANCSWFRELWDEDTEEYPAFGDNALRMQWLNRLKENNIPVPTLVHPSAYVSPTAKLGVGTVVLPKAVVNTEVILGDGCLINIGALVDHTCIIGDGAHLAPGAIVKAENQIPAGMKIEAGTVVENRTYPLEGSMQLWK